LQWNREELVQRNAAFNRALKNGFSLKVISMIGEGDSVAAEVIGDGVRAATGRHYVQHFSFHWTIRDGRILGIRFYEDTLHDWDIWCNPGPPVAGQGLAGVSGPAPVVGLPGGEPRADDPEEDKAIVHRFLLSIPTRNPRLTVDTWAPDGVWSFALGGDYLPAARTFQDAPHWVRDAMIGMQEKGQKTLKEPLSLDIYSMIAENGEVSAEAIGVLIRANGRAYRQHYSFHFKLRDRRIVEGHAYGDTLHGYDLGLPRAVYAPVAAPIEVGGDAQNP
jgi:ketosteroid isomerase-like protein